MRIAQVAFLIIMLTVLVLGINTLFQKDTYVGFYYPDKNDLTYDIQSEEVFSSIGACRDWIDGQISKYNLDGSSYDYECGKNCDLSGRKPYVCEETLE